MNYNFFQNFKKSILQFSLVKRFDNLVKCYSRFYLGSLKLLFEVLNGELF